MPPDHLLVILIEKPLYYMPQLFTDAKMQPVTYTLILPISKAPLWGFKSYVHITCRCEHWIVHVQLAVLEYMYIHPRTYKPAHHDKLLRYN